MKISRKKSVVLVVVTFLLIFVLAACNSGDNEKKSEGEIADAPPEPVELNVFIGTNGVTHEVFMKNWGGDFVQKKYPHISFNVLSSSQIEPSLLEGKKIDLVQVQRASIQKLMLNPQLSNDISDLINKNKFDLNKINPSILEEMRDLGEVATGKKGAILGMPISTQVNVLYYNKDLFDKFGVAYPVSGMTWDQFKKMSDNMSRLEDRVNYLGSFIFPRHYHLLNQYSQGYVDPVSGKATINNANWQSIFKAFASLYQPAGNTYDKANWQNTFWKDGRMAMMVRFFSPTDISLLNSTINWDIAELPSMADRLGIGSGMLNYYFHMASTSENRDAAFLYLSAIASEEYQLQQARLGNIPVLATKGNFLESFGKDAPQLKGKNIKALLVERPATPFRFQQDQGLVDAVVDKAFDSVATGTKDINTALREAEEQANKIIEEAKNKKK
jgi:multiple sugar transport system substrate-binding protein